MGFIEKETTKKKWVFIKRTIIIILAMYILHSGVSCIKIIEDGEYTGYEQYKIVTKEKRIEEYWKELLSYLKQSEELINLNIDSRLSEESLEKHSTGGGTFFGTNSKSLVIGDLRDTRILYYEGNTEISIEEEYLVTIIGDILSRNGIEVNQDNIINFILLHEVGHLHFYGKYNPIILVLYHLNDINNDNLLKMTEEISYKLEYPWMLNEHNIYREKRTEKYSDNFAIKHLILYNKFKENSL